MGPLQQIYLLLFGWLPPVVAVLFLGLFSTLIVFLILRIVKIILDSLPFL